MRLAFKTEPLGNFKYPRFAPPPVFVVRKITVLELYCREMSFDFADKRKSFSEKNSSLEV